MIMYASRTGTQRNLAALRAAGWRLLVSARGALRTEGFRYCLDNGAWTSYQRGEPFSSVHFEAAIDLLGDNADFVILPDIVGGGVASLRMSMDWAPRLDHIDRLMLPVQDGMTPDDVAAIVHPRIGIAIGGTTEWKETTMRQWGELAREKLSFLHVLRVNTRRRIRLCQDAGADSCDGTSVTRFAKTLPLLDGASRQQHMFGGRNE